MRSICLIMLMLCIDAGIGAEANAQNFWNKVKKEVHKAVNNQSQRHQSPSRKPSESSTSAVGQSDKAILNSCGLSEISLRPIGKNREWRQGGGCSRCYSYTSRRASRLAQQTAGTLELR